MYGTLFTKPFVYGKIEIALHNGLTESETENCSVQVDEVRGRDVI